MVGASQLVCQGVQENRSPLAWSEVPQPVTPKPQTSPSVYPTRCTTATVSTRFMTWEGLGNPTEINPARHTSIQTFFKISSEILKKHLVTHHSHPNQVFLSNYTLITCLSSYFVTCTMLLKYFF